MSNQLHGIRVSWVRVGVWLLGKGLQSEIGLWSRLLGVAGSVPPLQQDPSRPRTMGTLWACWDVGVLWAPCLAGAVAAGVWARPHARALAGLPESPFSPTCFLSHTHQPPRQGHPGSTQRLSSFPLCVLCLCLRLGPALSLGSSLYLAWESEPKPGGWSCNVGETLSM